MKSYLAEFIGTFALVFCGTGAIVINQQTSGQISHAGIAITFGLIVTVMIYTFGNVSGAHLNPAVTISFYGAGLFSKKEILPYVLSQSTGGLTASLTLKLLFPENQLLGATLPTGSEMQSFVLELLLTFFLMLTILHTSQGIKEIQQLAGLVIGGVVLLEAMFAGPICGASMNPARSLGPALISGHVTSLWIYLTAPVLGAGLGTLVWKITKAEKATF